MKNWQKQFKNKRQIETSEVLKPEEDKEEIKYVEEIFPKGMTTNEIRNEIDEIKKWGKNRWKDFVYKLNKNTYDFQQYWTRSFSDSIYNSKTSIDEGDIDQSCLLDGLKDFNDSTRPKTAEGKNKKRNAYKCAYILYEGR